MCENGNIGCSICKNGKLLGLGVSSAQSTHLSNGWSTCSVRRDGEKAAAQKALRKKIQKHEKYQVHIPASKILAEQRERKIETASLKGVEHSRELTEKYLRTAYLLATITDY